MPAQPRPLPRITGVPLSPGAVNLTADELDYDDIIEIRNEGARKAQANLAELQAFFIAPFFLPARVVTLSADAVFVATDVLLLMDLDTPAPLTIDLPTPVLNRVIGIKDKAGNMGPYNITLDAGSGKLINGQRTLVNNADWGTTLLVGMSSTQWGTLI